MKVLPMDDNTAEQDETQHPSIISKSEVSAVVYCVDCLDTIIAEYFSMELITMQLFVLNIAIANNSLK